MIHRYKYLIAVACMINCCFAFAQQINPLKIGDTVPDIFLKKMLNHTSSSGQLSDFKGKAIIIDQWFIGCAPCVSAMPKMDSLQKQFSNDLQILPVTFEKTKSVQHFWAEDPLVKNIQLTQVVEDTLVRAYFPAVSFPQQVWIDKNRKIVAITDGNSTTNENVRKLIVGEKLSIDVKADELDFNIRRATNPNMVIRYEQNKNKILFYSYFSKYRGEFSGMAKSKVDTVNKIVRVFNNNNSLFGLYDFAYANNSSEMRHIPSRFIRKDSNPIKGEVENLADTVYQFCYDLMYQGTTTKGFSKYMIADLDKFFNIRSHEELLDVVCYTIKPNGLGNRYNTKYNPNRRKGYSVSLYRAKKIIANEANPVFLEHNINGTSESPILIEVDRRKSINFEVTWDLSNLDLMNKELLQFDLTIEKGVRKRKVIILEDN